jgi:hypothetical protein
MLRVFPIFSVFLTSPPVIWFARRSIPRAHLPPRYLLSFFRVLDFYASFFFLALWLAKVWISAVEISKWIASQLLLILFELNRVINLLKTAFFVEIVTLTVTCLIFCFLLEKFSGAIIVGAHMTGLTNIGIWTLLSWLLLIILFVAVL